MEFVGTRMNGKEISIVFLLAFFAGRMNLFDGTFPVAAAFMSTMLEVSTVYIYLLPAVAGGMLLYTGQGVFVYGDLMAVISLSLIFLFFHQKKFTVNQRACIGAAVIIFSSVITYSLADILFALRPETLLEEILAFCIYLRAFRTITKVLYMKKSGEKVSGERTCVALELLLVSFAGAIGPWVVSASLWLLLIAAALYQRGLKEAMTLVGMAAVFSLCQGESQWQVYAYLLAGVVVAWYGASLAEAKYRKTVMGLILFFSVSSIGGPLVYGFGVAMAVFVGISPEILTRIGYMIEARFLPESSTEKDLQYLAINRDLQKKQEAFRSLGHLYGTGVEGKQIVSYQFMGMARTIDRLMEDLQGKGRTVASAPLIKVSVGQASYSFDEISGDSAAAFPFDDHHLALIISDGMGKGATAAAESKMVVTTLSRLLQAGFDVDLAMKTINGILMTGNEGERFATVDLAIIDRVKCRAKIYKMGAATTFIKHDGRVSMLKRQALPAGITSGLDLEYIDIKLKRGDLLVMVSDGVTDCDRKDIHCDWLRSRLLELGSKDPETIAELVVNKAAEKYGIHERDDLTVMAVAIGV